MLERACRALSVLAELGCVVFLVVLCVLKVQHFLTDPVSTAVSYQPSLPPAITVCHQLVDEQAVKQLEDEFRELFLDLQKHSKKTLHMLEEAKRVFSSYTRNILDESNSEVDTSRGKKNAKNMLQRTVNKAENMYNRRLRSDNVYDYSAMNETNSRLDDVLRESVITMQQVLEADQLSDLRTLNSATETLDRLVNITKEMGARIDTGEWKEPSPVRLLVESTRHVDQFVISCRRGNVNCMPEEGGVWQLRHVLETKERCYTLLAPEEEMDGEGDTVVLELRGNRWEESTSDETSDITTVKPGEKDSTSEPVIPDENSRVTTVKPGTDRRPIGPSVTGFLPTPSFVTSLNSSEGAPDAIQYVFYKLLLHAAPSPLLNAYGGLGERSFEIFNNQDWVEVNVNVEVLRSLNRKSRPCEEDTAYSRGSCLSECHAAAHARAAGCQLEIVWPATAQGLPQCETAAQLERLRAELTQSPSCACPRPCHQGRVSAVVQASSRTASDHNVTVLVRLDGDMQVIEESFAYTAGNLLTDFGGNLGLTMGFSLLTIVELLKKITLMFLDRDQVQKISEGQSDTWARVHTISEGKADKWADSIA